MLAYDIVIVPEQKYIHLPTDTLLEYVDDLEER